MIVGMIVNVQVYGDRFRITRYTGHSPNGDNAWDSLHHSLWYTGDARRVLKVIGFDREPTISFGVANYGYLSQGGA